MKSSAQQSVVDREPEPTRFLMSGSAASVQATVEQMRSDGWQILSAPIEFREGVWLLDTLRPADERCLTMRSRAGAADRG